MAERDANKQALDEVETATESEPVRGEELLESEELKRQLREAKERRCGADGIGHHARHGLPARQWQLDHGPVRERAAGRETLQCLE